MTPKINAWEFTVRYEVISHMPAHVQFTSINYSDEFQGAPNAATRSGKSFISNL